MPYETVAKWTGHADLDVMLNVYAGAFDDDEEPTATRREAYPHGLSVEPTKA